MEASLKFEIEIWKVDIRFCTLTLVLSSFFTKIISNVSWYWVLPNFWPQTNHMELCINSKLWSSPILCLKSSCKIKTTHLSMYSTLHLIKLTYQALVQLEEILQIQAHLHHTIQLVDTQLHLKPRTQSFNTIQIFLASSSSSNWSTLLTFMSNV